MGEVTDATTTTSIANNSEVCDTSANANADSSAPAAPAASGAPADSDAIDAGSMVLTGFPGRRLQRVRGQRLPQYQVIMQRHVLEQIHTHGKSSPEAEICGVLVGNVYRDLWGLFLLVDDSIRGDRADNKATQVTFKAETWNHIHDVMERDHPHQKIVGWYHTHPGFGIFLSGMDLFIQNNFFNLPWQVAFVYDPIGKDEGAFVWRNGKPVREEFLVQDVDPNQVGAPPTEELSEELSEEELARGAQPANGSMTLPQPRTIGRAVWAVGALVLALCAVAAYYVLAGGGT